MRDLSMMTWKEIKEIDKEKSIVFAVMAPIEEHGWHLPISTDLLEGEYWSRNAAKIVERKLNTECCYLPTFPIAASVRRVRALSSGGSACRIRMGSALVLRIR